MPKFSTCGKLLDKNDDKMNGKYNKMNGLRLIGHGQIHMVRFIGGSQIHMVYPLDY